MSELLQTLNLVTLGICVRKPRPEVQTVRHIGVIVGLDLVGDALMKLPFVRSLRRAFPKAELHWITGQGPTAYNDVLRPLTCNLIRHIHQQPAWLTGHGAGYGAEAAPYFDILIDTRNHRLAAMAARRVPHSFFVATALRYRLSDRVPALWKSFGFRPVHLVDRLSLLVELAAGHCPPGTGSLTIPAELQHVAAQLLPDGAIYVGIAPGAGNPIKIWPLQLFQQVAAEQVVQGRVPVFILGPQEAQHVNALRDAVPQALFPLQDASGWAGQGNLGIEHTLAVASRLDVAVANDSGVSHMLAAVDCPLVSLFGPTSPKKLAPRVSRGAVIRAQDYGRDQMDAIPVHKVCEEIERISLDV